MSTNISRISNHLDAPPETSPLYGCIHIPDFPVQAFVRNEPELRRRAVVVLDGTFPLFRVIATNQFARRAGVKVGMTKLQLERFPNIEVRYLSREQEDSMHRALLDCAHYFTPRVEDTATDSITLDLNGLSGLWGTPRAMAQKFFRAADKLGLDAHVATASNPDTAIHAAKTDAGITVITPGQEIKKLRSLPLHILSPSDEISETFDRWGLKTFQDLVRLPKLKVSERLGQEGVRLQQLAQGEASRPILATNEKLCFKESMELEDSINSLEPLTFILNRLLGQLCQRLRARNLTTNELNLDLTLEPAAKDKTCNFTRKLTLPVPIRDPQILLKLFQLDLDAHRPPTAIVRVALTAEPVQPRRIQNGLFLPLAPEPEKLELTLARIGAIVGEDNVGTPELLDTHRPDAFRVKRFSLRTKASRKRTTNAQPAAPPMALRALRPPISASVKMRQGHPSFIQFSGKSGKVLAATGPWNSSGQWWRTDPWDREEWDIEVGSSQHHTLYRIHQDRRTNSWFVDGIYD